MGLVKGFLRAGGLCSLDLLYWVVRSGCLKKPCHWIQDVLFDGIGIQGSIGLAYSVFVAYWIFSLVRFMLVVIQSDYEYTP